MEIIEAIEFGEALLKIIAELVADGANLTVEQQATIDARTTQIAAMVDQLDTQ